MYTMYVRTFSFFPFLARNAKVISRVLGFHRELCMDSSRLFASRVSSHSGLLSHGSSGSLPRPLPLHSAILYSRLLSFSLSLSHSLGSLLTVSLSAEKKRNEKNREIERAAPNSASKIKPPKDSPAAYTKLLYKNTSRDESISPLDKFVSFSISHTIDIRILYSYTLIQKLNLYVPEVLNVHMNEIYKKITTIE